MYDHLLDNEIARNYVRWLMHGEYEFSEPANTSTNESDMHDEMEEMLNDAFGMSMPNEESERSPRVHEEFEKPNKDAKIFYNLLREADHELYPGCKKYTKLSFIIRLFPMKCLNGWSNKSFTMLLELLKEALPEDSMLYSKEQANANECVVCGVSRWKSSDDHSTDEFTKSVKKKKIPAKVLRYFPLKPRLQRLYMSSKLASHMKWHVDGHMEETRNVRLGLASDGFNPFGNMSISHSMWPVVLIPYNLPPWMCMKQTFFMLSLLIPGPTAPGNDIDIYLQPLIDELNDLWEVGVETYDASTKQNFFGTLLSIDGKSKDNFNSRLDLQAMGIRDQLHLIQRGNRVMLLAACYSLTSNEKKEFCKFFKEVKVPNGYASNISRCVQVNERKIFGLKSHDCHVLMQQLLPLAIRGVLHKNVCVVIVELCSFFKQLCSKMLKIDQLEHLENDIIVTLCKLERIFPPSFFNVMVHLPIHLASEAKIVRPVQYRWMYLRTLKSYVHNKSRPEGSIAEGEHKQSIRVKPRIRARDVDLIHRREFISWFEERVQFLNTYYHCLVDQVHQLHVIEDTSLMGSDFTQENEKREKKSQNNGVVVPAEVSSFGSARDKNSIPGHVSYYDEPFVLAFQAKQVFYVQNSNDENCHTVVEIQTRGVYDMNQKVSTNDPEPYQQLITLHSQLDEMSHRRGRVQIVSLEDELDSLQQLLDIQLAATTTLSSSGPSDSSDPSIVDEERLCHRPPHLSDDDWRWLIHFWGTPEAKAQKKEDRSEPNRIEMFALTHTRKDGTPVDDHSKEIMDQFQQLLSQLEGTSSSTSASSGASTSVSSTSVASTYVDEIYTQVMGPERHGCVRGYGFGPTPTSIFGSTSRRRSGVILSTQLENAQEMLIAVEQKFTTATEELSNVKDELSHVKETFEERLIEVQKKTCKEVKEEFEEKMMEMQRKMQAQMQVQIEEQMMQQFQKKQ
ncbi:hypothetical protein CK203_111943 [Vitis vinifera]|uniref:DUF4218 domain-containing protein n=1 Tax=Vitis vinifera TaxID=29760 RepID=A0A438D0D5_VITVI|nr:hypothetical protein CK203_111943 [Vitis vinifera]